MDAALTRTAAPTPLIEVHRRTATVTGPFNARTTLHKPSHFPSPFERIDDDRYTFVTQVGGQVVGGQAVFDERTPTVELRLYLPVGTSMTSLQLDQTSDEIGRRLGLDLELPDFDYLWDADAILSRLPIELRGARPSSPFSLYEFLVICTVLQNTTVRRTVQMVTALADRLGAPYLFPSGQTLTSFWRPDSLLRLGEPKLRELRTGYRAKSLVRAAEYFAADHTAEQQLLSTVSAAERRDQLKGIYGVGPASVGYIMFEWFKETNEFSHVSPWELKILSKLLFDRMDVPASDLIAFAQSRWEPHTMLAVHAIFESIFWRRQAGHGPEWLDELIRL